MTESTTMRKVLELDAAFRRLTGREAFGYVSAPTPTTNRYVFQDGKVLVSEAQALEYMMNLEHLARTAAENLPYPFNQELAPVHDRRHDERWVNERLIALS